MESVGQYLTHNKYCRVFVNENKLGDICAIVLSATEIHVVFLVAEYCDTQKLIIRSKE